jgi:hypothetical protein
MTLAAAASPSAQAQSWDSVPSDDPQTHIATASWSDQTRIVARCDAGKLTAFVAQATPIAGAVVFVLTQRRPDAPSGGWWRLSEDGLSLVARQPGGFVRDLQKGGVLDIVVKSREADDWETTLMLPNEPGALSPVLQACGASAADLPAGPPVTWRVPPHPIAADYPEAALSAGLSGAAAVSCVAAQSGAPTDCIVIDETPMGYGFGYSAAKVVERGRLRMDNPELALSEPVYFQVTVPFQLDRRAAPELPFATRVRQETQGILLDPEMKNPGPEP